MIKLMKYEFLRKIKNLGIGLIILFIIELATLYTIYRGPSSLGYTLALTALMMVGVYIFLIIDSIIMYSSDLYKKPGYMLFLTPNSSSKIIGSKLLVSVSEAAIFLSLVFGSQFINYKIIYDKYLNSPQAQTILDALNTIFNLQTHIKDLLFIIFIFILSWFSLITIIYLAITLRKTILSNIKAGGLFSFIFFVVIETVVTYCHSLLVSQNMSITHASSTISIIYYSVVIVIMFVTSSTLLSKGVDL